MSDLTFLFLLIPGLVVLTVPLALWLVVRQQRRIRREVFGEHGVPLAAAFFPTSRPGQQYYANQHRSHQSGHHDHGTPFPHHSWDHNHGHAYSGHGPSHDYDSGSSSSSHSSSDSGGSSGSSSSDSGGSSSCD